MFIYFETMLASWTQPQNRTDPLDAPVIRRNAELLLLGYHHILEALSDDVSMTDDGKELFVVFIIFRRSYR